MGANANAIKQFNQKARQQQQQNVNPNQPVPNPNATPIVSPNASMSISDIQLLQADPAKLTPEQKLRRAALETKTNLKKIEDQKKTDQDAEEERAKEQQNQAQVIGHEFARGLRAAGDSKAKVWFENTPTVGGIGLLLLIIGVFLLAIVPVDSSGHTRLLLMWLTITGKTHVIYPTGGASSGDFGPSTPATTPTVPVIQGQPVPVAQPIPLSLPTIDLGITGFFNL